MIVRLRGGIGPLRGGRWGVLGLGTQDWGLSPKATAYGQRLTADRVAGSRRGQAGIGREREGERERKR